MSFIDLTTRAMMAVKLNLALKTGVIFLFMSPQTSGSAPEQVVKLLSCIFVFFFARFGSL